MPSNEVVIKALLKKFMFFQATNKTRSGIGSGGSSESAGDVPVGGGGGIQG